MHTATLNATMTIGGVSLNSTATRTGEGLVSHDLSGDSAIPAALGGAVSSTPGTITMDSAEHGLAENDVVDVYWDGGLRYGCTVGVVVTTAVPLTGGSGDSLPAEATEVTLCKQVTIDVDFDADKLEMIGVLCSARGRIGFIESASEVLSVDLTAGELWSYLADTGVTNPLDGHVVDSAVITQASESTASGKILALLDTVS